MAKDSPITAFLTEEEAAKLTPAAAQLTAGDLLSAMQQFKHKKGDVPKTAAAEALSDEDWKSVARAFVTQAMRRHTS